VTHDKCNARVELFGLTNVTIMIEINHPNMTNCDYNGTFDDVALLKLKKYFNFRNF
jgi:hypothetical protein